MGLFSSINDTSTEDEIKQLFVEVQSRFTKDQKKAVMASLMRVADSDREFHELEEKLLRLAAKMLDYELKGNRDEVKQDLFDFEAGEMLRALGGLDDEQKDWYIFTMTSMIEADGKVLEEEIEYAKIFLEHMEITNERVDNVKRESQFLSGYFS